MTNSADPDQQKPTDLDLHCLQRQGISAFSRIRVDCEHVVVVTGVSLAVWSSHKITLKIPKIKHVSLYHNVCVLYILLV